MSTKLEELRHQVQVKLKPFFQDFPAFYYNDVKVFFYHINYFSQISSRNQNDMSNKIRENVIGAIINGETPKFYFKDPTWKKLNDQILEFLCKINDDDFTTVQCSHRGGRNFTNDFNIIFNEDPNNIYKFEFKYNTKSVENAPQFVSPTKPSQYLSHSFEETFYDECLPKIAQLAKLPMPNKATYLQKIHSNKPECMKDFQDLYYQGANHSSQYQPENIQVQEFYKFCNTENKKFITNFIKTTELNPDILSKYLIKSQDLKIYMLYYKGQFYQQSMKDDFEIIEVTKHPSTHSYHCTTKSNKKFKVLLRWKNGNGIAYPAFQISWIK